MGTRMKGLLKGLRQISNIFEEEKEAEMQIGLPTDVKHVAHIGWDGPSVESPSWMKEYKGSGVAQSAPLDASGQPLMNPEVNWVSQDSSRRKSKKSSTRDLPELPKSSRRQSAESSATSPSPSRDPSKSRSSRRHHKRDSEGSGKGSRRSKELSNDAPDSPSTPTSKKLPDIPKKTRRKRSKESSHRSSKSKDNKDVNDGSIRSTRSEDSLPPTPFSDPGRDNADVTTGLSSNEAVPVSRPKAFVQKEEKGTVVVS